MVCGVLRTASSTSATRKSLSFRPRAPRRTRLPSAPYRVAARAVNLVASRPIYVTFNPSETDLIDIERGAHRRTVAAEIFLPGENAALPRGRAGLIIIRSIARRAPSVARAPSARGSHLSFPAIRAHSAAHQRDTIAMVPQAALEQSSWQIRRPSLAEATSRSAPCFARPHPRAPRSRCSQVSPEASTKSSAQSPENRPCGLRIRPSLQYGTTNLALRLHAVRSDGFIVWGEAAGTCHDWKPAGHYAPLADMGLHQNCDPDFGLT